LHALKVIWVDMYDDEVKIEEDLDFEIRFYEGLIDKKHDFVEALQALGDAYTRKGMFKKGLKVDEHLSLLQPSNPLVLYNLACSYSLVNETDKAFRSIKKAINCGYQDYNYLKRDKDLTNLHQDSRFKRYFSRLEKKKRDSG